MSIDSACVPALLAWSSLTSGGGPVSTGAAAAAGGKRQRRDRRHDAQPHPHGRTSMAGARRLGGAAGAPPLPPNSQLWRSWPSSSSSS